MVFTSVCLRSVTAPTVPKPVPSVLMARGVPVLDIPFAVVTVQKELERSFTVPPLSVKVGATAVALTMPVCLTFTVPPALVNPELPTYSGR